jgi:hypothetical protein
METGASPVKSLIVGLSLLAMCPLPATAQQILFDRSWTEQRFSLFSRNQYGLDGNVLSVASDGSVSLVWSALPVARWQSRAASWTWSVDTSVPATDLTRKGGDDRNLSLYFVFLPEQAALAAQGANIRALLRNDDVRVLTYVWGGAHRRGDILASPYLGARGKTLVLRPSGTGTATERIDLARDYRRAFGSGATSLVGLAVSADSDDTDSTILARIGDLRIE